MKIEIIKVPSGEINNVPYLQHLGKFKKKIILSTGMSKLKEIKNALQILINAGTPKKNITVLHCTSEYPTHFDSANLNTISYLKKKLKCSIGFSDHTIEDLAAKVAVTQGATIIEKHFKVDNDDSSIDSHFSMKLSNLRKFKKDQTGIF